MKKHMVKMRKIKILLFVSVLIFCIKLSAQENDSIPKLGSVDQVDNRMAIDNKKKNICIRIPLS
jgi:hypothetical protein